MADITFNTDDPQYVELLNGLGTLRTVLAPRIKLLLKMDLEKQKRVLARDPLLRRTILMARKLSPLVDLELTE